MLVASLSAASATAGWQGFGKTGHVVGPEVPVESLSGKVVMVDRWAIWCGPCRAMMPHTEAVWKKYGKRGLVVVASHIDYGYDKMKVLDFIRKNGFTFPVYKNAEWDGDVGYDGGIPFLYVIDADGKVAYGGRDPDALDSAIETALAAAEAAKAPAKTAAPPKAENRKPGIVKINKSSKEK